MSKNNKATENTSAATELNKMAQVCFKSIGNLNKLENRRLTSSVRKIELEYAIQMKSLAAEKLRFSARARMTEKLFSKNLIQKGKENDPEFPRQVKLLKHSSWCQEKNTSFPNDSHNNKNNTMLSKIQPEQLPKITTMPKIEIKITALSNENIANPQSELPHAKHDKEAKPAFIQHGVIHNSLAPKMRINSSKAPAKRRVSFHPMSVPKHTITASPKELVRRKSCPNLGWAKNRILAGGLTDKRNSLESQEISDIRKCRYLRVPEEK